jgi:release factor glutamine methyltransferase
MAELSFGTLRLQILHTVYQPSEDSFLLATYASSLSGKILEIGCGSGIASLSAARASPENSVLGLDINPSAVECAQANALANGLPNCKFILSDLFTSVPKGEKFDFILFNPPYLPTTREEKLALEAENAAYDGGENGLEVFFRFMANVRPYLAKGGKVAVIATSLGGGIEKTKAALEKNVGSTQILAQESFFFEKIALLEARMEHI